MPPAADAAAMTTARDEVLPDLTGSGARSTTLILSNAFLRLAHRYAELFSEYQRRNGQLFSQRRRLHAMSDDELEAEFEEVKAAIAARQGEGGS